jgi:hypothetical protein
MVNYKWEEVSVDRSKMCVKELVEPLGKRVQRDQKRQRFGRTRKEREL